MFSDLGWYRRIGKGSISRLPCPSRTLGLGICKQGWLLFFACCDQFLFVHGDDMMDKLYPVIGLMEDSYIFASSEEGIGTGYKIVKA